MARLSSLSRGKKKRRKIDLSTTGCGESLWLFYNAANLFNPTEPHPCSTESAWLVLFCGGSSGQPPFVMPVVPRGLGPQPERRSMDWAEMWEAKYET